MEAEVSELISTWRNAEKVTDLLGTLVAWRKLKPHSAPAIHRLVRMIYVDWIRLIKLDEFSIYQNTLNDSEREVCDRLAGWTIRDEIDLPAEVQPRNWTMKGIGKLRRGFIDESDIRGLAVYPGYDWELICKKLGKDFVLQRGEIEKNCLEHCRFYISSPTIIENLRINN